MRALGDVGTIGVSAPRVGAMPSDDMSAVSNAQPVSSMSRAPMAAPRTARAECRMVATLFACRRVERPPMPRLAAINVHLA
jgi:hypothetical protein